MDFAGLVRQEWWLTDALKIVGGLGKGLQDGDEIGAVIPAVDISIKFRDEGPVVSEPISEE